MGDGGPLEAQGEGEEGDDHDGLDVEDHVDGVGQAQIGLLHDQLWQGPSYTRQKAANIIMLFILLVYLYSVQYCT